jgi:hypothetical protein
MGRQSDKCQLHISGGQKNFKSVDLCYFQIWRTQVGIGNSRVFGNGAAVDCLAPRKFESVDVRHFPTWRTKSDSSKNFLVFKREIRFFDAYRLFELSDSNSLAVMSYRPTLSPKVRKHDFTQIVQAKTAR